MFRNVMVALGLGPDEEYDDRYLGDGYDDVEPDGGYGDERGTRPDVGFDDRVADVPSPASPRRGGLAGVTAGGSPSAGGSPQGGTVGVVRPIRSDDDGLSVRPIRPVGATDIDTGDELRPAVAAEAKPRTVSPQSFGDAKVIADDFKRGTPVVVNLTEVDRDLGRRLIDFASGVCYSLGGGMEKLAPNVFLLTPRGATVGADDRRRLEERGYRA